MDTVHREGGMFSVGADSATAALAAEAAAADAIAVIDCADSAADTCDSAVTTCAFRSSLAAGGCCAAGALAGASAVCVKPGVWVLSRGGGVRGAPLAALNNVSPAMCMPRKSGGDSAELAADEWFPAIVWTTFQRDWRERSAPR